jgi:Kdo2-lipid IVA lauroyltransferase/acyltransferase
MKKLQHLIEYSFLITFASVIRVFPLSFARFCARRFADIIFYLIPVRKAVVLKNLSDSFGSSKTREELNCIAHNTYRQFAQTMIEIIYFPKFNKERLSKLAYFENMEIVETALKGGKGTVLVGSHFCNWELMAAAIVQHFPLTLVVGEQKNTLVDDLLNSFRLKMGVKIVPLKVSLRGVTKALKANESVAIVSDQDAHEDGVFVDFFGRPASTPKGAAVFALRFGCPLIMGHIFRNRAGFKIKFDLVPAPESKLDETEQIRVYTQSYTKLLEDYVRKYPDHWFWMHKRWKTKPLTQP